MIIPYCTLLMNLLWVTYVIGGQTTPESSSVAEPPAPVLPLVLIQVSVFYRHPTKLETVATNDGFLCNGTKFSHKSEKGKQLLLCPSERSTPRPSNCLYPQEFQNQEILQCAEEPKPLIEKIVLIRGTYSTDISCTISNKSGKWYKTGYKICIPQESDHSPRKPSQLPTFTRPRNDYSEYQVFKFCYNEDNNEVLYTNHDLKSPNFLFDERLDQEREKKYEISIDSHEDLRKYFEILKQLYDKLQASSTSLFKPQWLVPPEDLAFATWKKTAYHYFNMKPMRTDKLQLWNHINNCIRKQAQKMNTQFAIYTSAIQLPKTTVEYIEQEIPIPDIWIKLIINEYETKEPGRNMPTTKYSAVVVVVNNNLNEDSLGQFYQNYCNQDLCNEAFSKNFPNVGNDARCCIMNQEILDIFHFAFKIEKNLEIDFSLGEKPDEKSPAS